MAHFIAAGTLFVVLLTALVNIASFLLSERDQKAIQDRLTDWYFYIDEGDWSRLVTSSAMVSERFLQHTFGPRFFSPRYFLFSIAFGVVFTIWLVSVASMHFIKGLDFHRHLLVLFAAWEFYAAAIVLALIDTVALGISRRVLQRLSNAKSSNGVLIGLAKVLLIGLSAAFLGLLAWGVISLTGELPDFGSYYLNYAGQSVSFDIRAIFFLPGWWPMLTPPLAVPACLSALLLFVTITASWGMSLLRPVARRPLALIVERLASTPKGLFATIVNGLLVVTALLTAWKGLQ